MIELDFKGLADLLSIGNPPDPEGGGWGCENYCNGIVCGGNCKGGYCGYSQCPGLE